MAFRRSATATEGDLMDMEARDMGIFECFCVAG